MSDRGPAVRDAGPWRPVEEGQCRGGGGGMAAGEGGWVAAAASSR